MSTTGINDRRSRVAGRLRPPVLPWLKLPGQLRGPLLSICDRLGPNERIHLAALSRLIRSLSESGLTTMSANHLGERGGHSHCVTVTRVQEAAREQSKRSGRTSLPIASLGLTGNKRALSWPGTYPVPGLRLGRTESP